LFYLGLGHDAFLARSREELGGNGNNVPVKMAGLEEQIEREEGSEERIEEKRRRIQATRSAVHEALLLWSSKASLLQVDNPNSSMLLASKEKLSTLPAAEIWTM